MWDVDERPPVPELAPLSNPYLVAQGGVEIDTFCASTCTLREMS